MSSTKSLFKMIISQTTRKAMKVIHLSFAYSTLSWNSMFYVGAIRKNTQHNRQKRKHNRDKKHLSAELSPCRKLFARFVSIGYILVAIGLKRQSLEVKIFCSPVETCTVSRSTRKRSRLEWSWIGLPRELKTDGRFLLSWGYNASNVWSCDGF